MSVNVLITGSNGYIGLALVANLKDVPFINKIIGYDLDYGNDILDEISLVKALNLNKIDVVIHLAALSSVAACNNDVVKAIQINAIGTRTILSAMKQTGCRNIIYASTSSVYGNNKHLPYDEDMIPSPCSPYGDSKMLGEHVIYNHYDLKGNPGSYLIFRMFNVVGTCGIKDIDTKVSSGYDRLFGALESGTVSLYGTDYDTEDGTCERDYVSLKDVCNSYVLGLKTIIETEQIREIINICSEIPISVSSIIKTWNQIAHCIKKKNNKHPFSKVQVIYGERRAGDPEKVYGSNDKAYELLGWFPQRKMENIIINLAIDKTNV